MGVHDKYDLMRFDSSGAVSTGMFDETWRRFVVKMATGTGKTKVLSLVLTWSFYHKLYEPGSGLARNFLVIAPNIIVLDRIYKDFQGLRIFLKDDPVIPDNSMDGRNWRDDFQLTLHVQSNSPRGVAEGTSVTALQGSLSSEGLSCFRPSWATHVFENSDNIRTVQELLGHRDVGTSMIYTHILNRGGLGLNSPTDRLQGGRDSCRSSGR